MPENETITIMHMLGRMEGKLDGILSKQAEQDRRLNSHGDRIARLEKSKVWLIGAAAGVGTVINYLSQWLGGAR